MAEGRTGIKEARTVMRSTRLAPSLVALQAWSDERGSWPSQHEWNAYAKAHGYLGTESLRYHRHQSWLALCAELGGQRSQAKEQAECLAAVREAAESVGPWMTKRQYDAWAQEVPGRPRLGVVTRRCGGRWNRTKALAQLPQNPAINTHIWSEAEMLNALRQAAIALGEEAYEAWRGAEWPSVETIRMYWGSLNVARAQMALTTQEPGGVVRYTEDDWQQALRDFIGFQMTAAQYHDWAQSHDAPSLQVLRKRAGGFWKALETVGVGEWPKSSMARTSKAPGSSPD